MMAGEVAAAHRAGIRRDGKIAEQFPAAGDAEAEGAVKAQEE